MYLDPGSGSVLIQLLFAGGVCGGGLALIYGVYRLIRKAISDGIKDAQKKG